MADDASSQDDDRPQSRQVFAGESRKVLCRDVSDFGCDRVMNESAENCGNPSHIRSVPAGKPRGDAEFRTRSSVYRRHVIVDEEYELVFNDSKEVVELDRETFEPNRLWVSVKVQREFTEYHGCEAEEAISNIRLLVRKAFDEGRYSHEEWGGYKFWWRGFSVTVDPSLDVVIRYRTTHYERTPQQVSDGVKSRLSTKRGFVSREQVFPTEAVVGDIMEGVVAGVRNYGVFVRITDHFEALMHISVLGNDPESLELEFIPGQLIWVEVINVDQAGQRISLRPVISD